MMTEGCYSTILALNIGETDIYIDLFGSIYILSARYSHSLS